ncbi:hypothetical protein LRH25_16670 [Ideonella azotifigens]|uniref:DUF1566 domain-containing protein n=1 Tax=Ideonella azotifigens TaxID=513160 RepID=A0ABN1JJB7_9BURK|nr:TorF family putative porin [Ideonella azotifigens]MCD2341976.1 hypothetical protein [Ideonella azotifigens]
MPTPRLLIAALALALPLAAALPAHAESDTASFAVDTSLKLSSDQRTRGISDSLKKPGLRLSVEAAHESGLIGLIEVATVSKKQFLEGDGLGFTVAGGYRFGDPEGWHFGLGLATEFFPGAKFDAPHGFDFETFTPTDVRSSNFNSKFAVLEINYGELEGRVLNVISKTYRGADTGGVCGTMLALNPDPTPGLACYARGDQNSRGSWLFDLGYKFNLAPATTLNLHAGLQKIKHFKEADFSDYSIGITHKQWGFEWNADWMTSNTKARELYLAVDGSKLRATDDNRFVVSVLRRF